MKGKISKLKFYLVIKAFLIIFGAYFINIEKFFLIISSS